MRKATSKSMPMIKGFCAVLITALLIAAVPVMLSRLLSSLQWLLPDTDDAHNLDIGKGGGCLWVSIGPGINGYS